MNMLGLGGFDMKKRCVQFVVKSAMGRFIKDVSKHHLEDPKMSLKGIDFELHNLELNERVINEEVLGHGSSSAESSTINNASSRSPGVEAPLRLVRGTIASLKGQVLWTLGESRSLEVEGIDLTFDVMGQVNPNAAGTQTEQQLSKSKRGMRDGGGSMDSMTGSSARESTLYSSMIAGQVTEEIIKEAILQEQEENATIDDGVDVLSTVIKSLVHNTVGEVKEITLRFRIPPPDREITPGRPLPVGTVELLIHLPMVNIKDETDPVTSIGNSFRKRITATGWFVQLYDAPQDEDATPPRQRGEGSDEEEVGEEENSPYTREATESIGSRKMVGPKVQLIKMENTVFSGDTKSVCNEVVLQYFDVEKQGATRWRTEVSLGEVHCLLTPPQLCRLLQVTQVLTRAPTATDALDEDGNSTTPPPAPKQQEEERDSGEVTVDENGQETTKRAAPRTKAVTETPSVFRFECAKMAVALLHNDTPKVVLRCWRALRDGGDVLSVLTTAHYSLSLDRLILLSSTPVDTKYLDDDDVLLPVFERYGGSYLSVALRSIDLMEKQPGKEREPIIQLRRVNDAPELRGRYQLALSIITSCPMSPSLAQHYGFTPQSKYRNIVRQLSSLELNSQVEVTADALLLDRLLFFCKQINDLSEAAAILSEQEEENELRHNNQVALALAVAGKVPNVASADSEFDLDTLDLDDVRGVSDEDVKNFNPEKFKQAAIRQHNRTPPHNRSGATAGGHSPMTPPVERRPYDVVSSFDLDVNSIVFEHRFLKIRQPNPDLYGPLTQRLFSALGDHDGSIFQQAAAAAANFRAPPNAGDHLSKSLCLSVTGLEFRLPNGNTDLITINAHKLNLALKDQLSGLPPSTLAEVTLSNPHQQQHPHSGSPTGVNPHSPNVDEITANFFPPPPPMVIRMKTLEEQEDLFQRQQHQQQGLSNKRRRGAGNHFKSSDPDEASEVKEQQMHEEGDVAVTLTIYSIKVRLHQDDFLLLLFAMDEISDAVTSAVRRADSVIDPAKAEALLAQEEEERKLQRHDPNAAELFFSGIPAPTAGGGGAGDSGASGSSMNMSSRKRRDRLRKAALRRRPSYESRVSVALHVDTATMILKAARLSPDQVPVGEPLWMLYTPEQKEGMADKGCAFHNYVINAQGVDLHIGNNTLSQTTLELLVNVRADHLDLNEVLPTLPKFDPQVFLPPATERSTVVPLWGEEVSLLQGYANLYRRSHDSNQPSRKVFRMCLYRLMDTGAKTQDMNVDIQLDRVAINHQPAYDGDHWLFALMTFVSDAPLSTVEDDESIPDSQTAIDPYSCKTRVVVKAIDTLLEYRPYGHKSMMLALAPTMTVDTGSMVANSPKATIQISVDSVDMFLHDDWPYELVGYDAERGAASFFGTTNRGLMADLRELGFITMGKIVSTDQPGYPNVLLRLNETVHKPLLVEVVGLRVELEAASDSFKLFQLVLTHFGSGYDRAFFPSPFTLVKSNGAGYLKVKPPMPPPRGPQVKVLVDAFADLIAERLQMTYSADPPPAGTGPSSQSSRPTARQGSMDGWDDVDFEVAGGTPQKHRTGGGDASSMDTAPSALHFSFDNSGSKGRRSRGPQHVSYVASSTHNLKHMVNDDEDGFVDIEVDREPRQGPVVQWNEENLAEVIQQNLDGGMQSQQNFSVQGPGNVFQQPPTLSSLFSTPDYFSVRRRQQNIGTAGGETQPRDLPSNMPPVAVEIVVTRVNAVVKFYGGMDLGSTYSSTRPEQYNTMHTFHGDFREHATTDGQRVLQSSRNPAELVVGTMHGVRVQCDLFEEGHDKAMHLLVSIASVEVKDEVKSSNVNKLLACTIPPEHRDVDTPMFEMKWITLMPQVGGGGQLMPKPEEELSLRCQPLYVSLNENTFWILAKFFVQDGLEALVQDGAGLGADPTGDRWGASENFSYGGGAPTAGGGGGGVPSATHIPNVSGVGGPVPPMFFNKFMIHPLDLSLSWFPMQNPSLAGLGNGEPINFARITSLEGSRVKLSGLCIQRASMDELGLHILEAAMPQIKPNVLLFLCGLGPVRTVGEVAGAAGELVLTPWKSLKKNRGLYKGIIKGLTNCGERLTAEAFRVGSATSHIGHRAVHALAAPVQPIVHKDPMLRGDQPVGVGDGLTRGAQAVNNGLVGMGEAVQVCIGEEGHVAQLPLVLLVPIDGAMRGMTEVFLGLRNFFKPDSRTADLRQFKPGFGQL